MAAMEMGKKKSAKITKAECGGQISLEFRLGVLQIRRISYSQKFLPHGSALFADLKDWGHNRGSQQTLSTQEHCW